jgi:hypothetical protein
MQPLKSILGRFVKDLNIEDGTVLNSLRRQWQGIVGIPIAAHTWPDTIKGKILTISVDTPQWMHHLSFFKGEITEKLRSRNIEDIRFRIGKIPVKQEQAPDACVEELSEDDRRFIENTVGKIGDEELKEKFIRLISHGLTRGKAPKGGKGSRGEHLKETDKE